MKFVRCTICQPLHVSFLDTCQQTRISHYWLNLYTNSLWNSKALKLHVLNHTDHCLQSRSIKTVSIICHYLPSFSWPKSSLDTEWHFLILSTRTGVPGVDSRALPWWRPFSCCSKASSPSQLFVEAFHPFQCRTGGVGAEKGGGEGYGGAGGTGRGRSRGRFWHKLIRAWGTRSCRSWKGRQLINVIKF